MQIRSHTATHRPDTSAQDAARYGHRLAEIAQHLASVPGEDMEKARLLLKQAADNAEEAARLMEGITPGKLRLHINFAGQPDLLSESVRFLLEKARGDAPVTIHRGASQENLPFGVQITTRLVSQVRALLGDDAVWTETRS